MRRFRNSCRARSHDDDREPKQDERHAEETARASLPRYVLEVGVVELCHVEPLQPFDELIARLDVEAPKAQ